MNIRHFLMTGVLINSAFTMNAIAADIEAGIVKNIPPSASLRSDSFRLSVPLEIKHSASSDGIQAKAATGIKYFEVGYVYSSNYGLEAISPSQYSTVYDHGGSQLYVYVWQYGYGNPNDATLNGISKKPDLSDSRCGTDLHQCNTGETVTGWLYGFDFSGQASGQFKASANSTAAPFGYWSDSVYIN